MSGPLAGLRVIDLTAIGPGPFAGMMLGDLGADVIRVERTAKSAARPELFVPHRNRRSVVIDLKQPDGVALAFRLVDSADVLLEGNRPGVMERLGLGPEVCLQRNPRLIYGRMTGWGQDGPLAGAVGHDIDYLAIAGALGLLRRRDERPLAPLNLLADYGGGGMLLVVGVLAALVERSVSGEGQVVDAAMVDGVAALLHLVLAQRAQGRWVDEPESNLSDSGAPFYETYETADGRHLAVGAVEPTFYAALLAGLGLDPAALPKQYDRKRWPETKRRFADVIRRRPLAEWIEVFDGTDACAAPVLTMDEALDHPHLRARGTYVEFDGVAQPAPAPRFSRTPGAIRRSAPAAGADTDSVLAELGYAADDIAALRSTGAVA